MLTTWRIKENIKWEVNFNQVDGLHVIPWLYIRCTEIDRLEEAYELIRKFAKENEIETQGPFFHVYFDAFDQSVLDIYITIKKEESRFMKWIKSWFR